MHYWFNEQGSLLLNLVLIDIWIRVLTVASTDLILRVDVWIVVEVGADEDGALTETQILLIPLGSPWFYLILKSFFNTVKPQLMLLLRYPSRLQLLPLMRFNNIQSFADWQINVRMQRLLPDNRIIVLLRILFGRVVRWFSIGTVEPRIQALDLALDLLPPLLYLYSLFYVLDIVHYLLLDELARILLLTHDALLLVR